MDDTSGDGDADELRWSWKYGESRKGRWSAKWVRECGVAP